MDFQVFLCFFVIHSISLLVASLLSAAVPALTSPCFQFIAQLLQGVFSDEQPRMKSVGHHQESVGWSDADLAEFSSPFAVGHLGFACQARSCSSAVPSVLETSTHSTVLGHVPCLSFHPLFVWGCVVVKNNCLSYCGVILGITEGHGCTVSYSHTIFGWWLLLIPAGRTWARLNHAQFVVCLALSD